MGLGLKVEGLCEAAVSPRPLTTLKMWIGGASVNCARAIGSLRSSCMNGTEPARVNLSWPVHTRGCRNGAYTLHPCMFRAFDGVC